MTFIVPRPYSHASPRSMGPAADDDAAAAALEGDPADDDAAASDASDENDDERCDWELSNHQDLSAAAPALPAATEGSGVAQAPITTIPCSAPAPAPPLLLLCRHHDEGRRHQDQLSFTRAIEAVPATVLSPSGGGATGKGKGGFSCVEHLTISPSSDMFVRMSAFMRPYLCSCLAMYFLQQKLHWIRSPKVTIAADRATIKSADRHGLAEGLFSAGPRIKASRASSSSVLRHNSSETSLRVTDGLLHWTEQKLEPRWFPSRSQTAGPSSPLQSQGFGSRILASSQLLELTRSSPARKGPLAQMARHRFSPMGTPRLSQTGRGSRVHGQSSSYSNDEAQGHGLVLRWHASIAPE